MPVAEIEKVQDSVQERDRDLVQEKEKGAKGKGASGSSKGAPSVIDTILLCSNELLQQRTFRMSLANFSKLAHAQLDLHVHSRTPLQNLVNPRTSAHGTLRVTANSVTSAP
jgi:hypothetical protein